jgi:hypothetical protein
MSREAIIAEIFRSRGLGQDTKQDSLPFGQPKAKDLERDFGEDVEKVLPLVSIFGATAEFMSREAVGAELVRLGVLTHNKPFGKDVWIQQPRIILRAQRILFYPIYQDIVQMRTYFTSPQPKLEEVIKAFEKVLNQNLETTKAFARLDGYMIISADED